MAAGGLRSEESVRQLVEIAQPGRLHCQQPDNEITIEPTIEWRYNFRIPRQR